VEIIPAQVKIQDQVPQKEATTERPASGPKSKKKYFLIGLVVLLFISLTSIATYWYFVMSKPADTSSEPKSEEKLTKTIAPKLLRLSSKPLDEPSYLVYVTSEEIERNRDNNLIINYRLMRIKEDGTEKKEVFSYISDEINEEDPTRCTFRTYGQDNVVAACNDELKIFDKLGVRSKKAETFNSKYEDKYSLYTYTSEVSPNNFLLAYSELKLDRFKVSFEDPKQKNIVKVLNLETLKSKSYELPGSFNRPTLHFSPDNSKLYACYCGFGWEGPFFWQGPTEANFEIDLPTLPVSRKVEAIMILS